MIINKTQDTHLAFHIAPLTNSYTFNVAGNTGASLLSEDFYLGSLPKFIYINKNIMYFDTNDRIWKFKRPVIATLSGVMRLKSLSASNIVYLYSSNSRIIAPYTFVTINNTGFTNFSFSVTTLFQAGEFPAFTLNTLPDDLIIENNSRIFDYHCYVKPLSFEEEYFYIKKN